MKFWDASALVPLCCAQPASAQVNRLARADETMVVWWATPVEIVSALARLGREGALTAADVNATLALLGTLREAWTEVLPVDGVRERAERLLRAHSLRAADALQLAAALVWVADRPAGAVLVTLDDRLRTAATQEGFTVEP